jgi:hypothetical protein
LPPIALHLRHPPAPRPKERCLGCLGMRGIDVKLVARAMCLDAEQPGHSSNANLAVYGDAEIRALTR